MRRSHRQSAAAHAAKMRELRALGYQSDIFPARYPSGVCPLSKLPIRRQNLVAYFRDLGLCHAAAIDILLSEERRAATPKCGCGAPVVDEAQAVCARCFHICETWFDCLPEDVSRESSPAVAP